MSAREPTPQEQARLEAIRRQWQQKRLITERLGKIGTKLAVYSGKGGVGKTTVAVNLATTLAELGSSVGILDADIDCPNVVRAMKADEATPNQHNGALVPDSKWGVKVLSMGFFQQNEDEAIIFRGPMIHNEITQFLEATDWGELDYLVADLPPGTSDAPLTIMQSLPLDGFIIVATPQELAKIDAKRSINMVRKMNLPALGVVENLSGDIFGQGAGEELAHELNLPFLGRLSMRSSYQDTSKPTVLLDPEVQAEYRLVISNVQRVLSQQSQNS